LQKPLATVRDYADLHAALRARAAALNVSRETIDDIAGLQAGYAAKLLAPNPQGSLRVMGHYTLGLMLGALGLKLLVVVDDAALAKVARRLVQRCPGQTRDFDAKRDSISSEDATVFRYFSALGSLGGRARVSKISPARRKAIARKAARARWSSRGA
jgi:hypothetical protein